MGVLWTGAGTRRKPWAWVAHVPRGGRTVAAAVAVATTWMAGCSYMSDVKASDPALTAEALRSGRLAIVGVVQVNEVPEVRPPLIEALERVLGATRPDIPIVPASKVAPALDDSTERFLLLGYQMHGKADPEWLARASQPIRTMARFALLARVEAVKVRHSDRVDASGTSSNGVVQVTGRDVRVGVSIYDVKTLTLVFAGDYWGSKEDAHIEGEAPPTPPEDDLDVESTVDTTVAGVYRKPSPVARAAEPAFLEFARSLPGSASGGAGGGAR
jgi:hypothetical protein